MQQLLMQAKYISVLKKYLNMSWISVHIWQNISKAKKTWKCTLSSLYCIYTSSFQYIPFLSVSVHLSLSHLLSDSLSLNHSIFICCVFLFLYRAIMHFFAKLILIRRGGISPSTTKPGQTRCLVTQSMKCVFSSSFCQVWHFVKMLKVEELPM